MKAIVCLCLVSLVAADPGVAVVTVGSATLANGRSGTINVRGFTNAQGYGISFSGSVSDSQSGDKFTVASGYDCSSGSEGEALVSNGLTFERSVDALAGGEVKVFEVGFLEVAGHALIILDSNNKVAGCGRIVLEGEGQTFSFAIVSGSDLNAYVVAEQVSISDTQIVVSGNAAGSFSDKKIQFHVVDGDCDSADVANALASSASVATLQSGVNTAFFRFSSSIGIAGFANPRVAIATDETRKPLACGAFTALAQADECSDKQNSPGFSEGLCFRHVTTQGTCAGVQTICANTCCKLGNPSKELESTYSSGSVALVGLVGLVLGAAAMMAFNRKQKIPLARLDDIDA